MLRTILIFLALVGPLSAQRGVDGARPDGTPRAEKRDVLLLLLDDIGLQFLEDAPTPNLDSIRHRGVEFLRAYVNPVCSPTRAALNFGRNAGRTGVGSRVVAQNDRLFAPSYQIPSLAGVLSGNGVRTCLVGKWHLSGEVNSDIDEGPRAHGYGAWRCGIYENFPPSQDFFSYTRVDDGLATQDTQYLTTAQTEAAVAWWTDPEQAGSSRFLCLAYNAVHKPYQAPPAHLLPFGPSGEPGDRGLGLDMLQALDFELGKLLAVVDLSRTTVIVLGDNGTGVGLVGPTEDPNKAKTTVFEGGVHVPMFVAGPDVPMGRTADALVHAVDFFPTITELLDVPVRPDAVGDGVSFAKVLRTPSRQGARDWVLVQRFLPNGLDDPATRTLDHKAVIERRYKLMVRDGLEEVYDLTLDPREEAPLSPDDPALRKVVERLRTVLADHGELPAAR